jgi:hypothetical protein
MINDLRFREAEAVHLEEQQEHPPPYRFDRKSEWLFLIMISQGCFNFAFSIISPL